MNRKLILGLASILMCVIGVVVFFVFYKPPVSGPEEGEEEGTPDYTVSIEAPSSVSDGSTIQIDLTVTANEYFNGTVTFSPFPVFSGDALVEDAPHFEPTRQFHLNPNEIYHLTMVFSISTGCPDFFVTIHSDGVHSDGTNTRHHHEGVVINVD